MSENLEILEKFDLENFRDNFFEILVKFCFTKILKYKNIEILKKKLKFYKNFENFLKDLKLLQKF